MDEDKSSTKKDKEVLKDDDDWGMDVFQKGYFKFYLSIFFSNIIPCMKK